MHLKKTQHPTMESSGRNKKVPSYKITFDKNQHEHKSIFSENDQFPFKKKIKIKKCLSWGAAAGPRRRLQKHPEEGEDSTQASSHRGNQIKTGNNPCRQTISTAPSAAHVSARMSRPHVRSSHWKSWMDTGQVGRVEWPLYAYSVHYGCSSSSRRSIGKVIFQ